MNFTFTNSSYTDGYWVSHQNSQSGNHWEFAKDIDWSDLINMYEKYMGNLFDNGEAIDLSIFLTTFTSAMLMDEFVSIERLNLLYLKEFTDKNIVRYKLRFKADKDYKLPEKFIGAFN